MSTKTKIFPIVAKPGIKRDGTAFEGDGYVDGEWVRWQRGLPRKIGGYREISREFAGPARAVHVFNQNNQIFVHQAAADAVQKIVLTSDGFGGGVIDRTPSGYAAGTGQSWQLEDMYDDADGSAGTLLLAFSAGNLSGIDSDAPGAVYYGGITATGALALATGIPSLSGGICAVEPYLFVFGSDGQIAWSDANLPLTFTGGDAGSDRITGTKIVAGKPTRAGGTNAPSALFWTLDSLMRASYVGSPAIFRFDTISDQTSILSPTSIIEYDGVFYWIGVDRFLMYNGIVQELPNDMSLNFFFDNLNYSQRAKVWATKVPRFGEIWWHAPLGNSTECNHAFIYNVREKTWYDTPLSRSAGYYSQVFRYPIWAGVTTTATDSSSTATGYQLWQHEYGADRIERNQVLAIRSYFETPDIAWVDGGPMQTEWIGNDAWVRAVRFEPDFVQSGDMTLTVLGRKWARGDDERSGPYTFGPDTDRLDLKVQRREMRLRIESNTQGGDYQMGQCLLTLGEGDRRQ